MSKISLCYVAKNYIASLHQGDEKKISKFDVFYQIITPIIIAVLITINADKLHGSLDEALQGLLTWVSITSSLIFAVVVMVYQLRMQLIAQKEIKPEGRELKVIDEIFYCTLWAVVAGFTSAAFIVVKPLVSTYNTLIGDLFAGLAIALSLNLVFVTCMTIKRIGITYEVISKRWSKKEGQ